MSAPSAPFCSEPQPAFNTQHSVAAFSVLDESQSLDALLTYANKHCCWNKKFVSQMSIKDIIGTPIYLYTVEQFLEKRTKEWSTEPYRGEYIQSSTPSPVPVDIWSLRIEPVVQWAASSQNLEVPGSVSIVNCNQCSGTGNVQCGVCSGSTMVGCLACTAQGFLIDPTSNARVLCKACRGNGKISCLQCKGKGTVNCGTCLGFRRIKSCEKLLVEWSLSEDTCVHKENGIVNIPLYKIQRLKPGHQIEEKMSTMPVDMSSISVFRQVMDNNFAAQSAVPHQRIIGIRQRIFVYPGTELTYFWKDNTMKYVLIYGKEKKVFFPEGYPAPYCGCFGKCTVT